MSMPAHLKDRNSFGGGHCDPQIFLYSLKSHAILTVDWGDGAFLPSHRITSTTNVYCVPHTVLAVLGHRDVQ